VAKKWIQGAIKHPGALHKELGVPMGETIPKEKIAKAAQAGGKLGQRARLAETLGKMHSHMPKGVSLSPMGDLGHHGIREARVLGTFKNVSSMKPSLHFKPFQAPNP